MNILRLAAKDLLIKQNGSFWALAISKEHWEEAVDIMMGRLMDCSQEQLQEFLKHYE